MAMRPRYGDHVDDRLTTNLLIAGGALLTWRAIAGLRELGVAQTLVALELTRTRELEALNEAKARATEHARDEWLASQRTLCRPPPLERRPGEDPAVFELKQLARREFLSGRFE